MTKLLIAGDYFPQNRVAELIDRHDYEPVFGDILPIIEQADYSIVNLECPVVERDCKPIVKSGPNLKSTIKGIEAIRYAGFNLVTLANNHFYDYGDLGVEDTLDACNKYNIETIGGGINLQEASNVLYKEIDGIRFAFINCCEHEFSIATTKSGGSNPLDIIKNYHQIQEAKRQVDYVILIIHGGHEHYQLPSPRMKETFRFFIEAGASVIVNHHQHCYSGYEFYNNGYIFYGLGNFCFDHKKQRDSIWNKGYMVMLSFDKKNISFELYPYVQNNKSVGLKLLNDRELSQFNDVISELNQIIQNDTLLQKNYIEYVEHRYKNILSIFEPYNSRMSRAIYNRLWLPSFFRGNRVKIASNIIFCESHFDVLKSALYKKMNISEF